MVGYLLGYPVMGSCVLVYRPKYGAKCIRCKKFKARPAWSKFYWLVKSIGVALFIIPGIICYVLYPKSANPDEAYMTMVTNLFPEGMKWISNGVLIAALVGTIDSCIKCIKHSFYKRYLCKKNK